MNHTLEYEIPVLSDKELQQEIDKEGMSGLVTPQQLKEYVHKKIYEMFLEAANSSSAKYTQTVQHHDSSK